MRIMELYRIESDYKNHKKRLESIRSLNSKDKIKRITSQHFNITAEHKKIKAQDHSFQEKAELSRREHSLELMNKTIMARSKKQKQDYELGNIGTTLQAVPSKGTRNNNRNTEKDQTHNQFLYLQHKIQNMKSVYKKIRRNSEYETLNVKGEVEKRKTERDKVIELLKAQFNIEPKVVFPRCKTKQTVGAHLPSESESGQKREHLESVTSSGRPL